MTYGAITMCSVVLWNCISCSSKLKSLNTVFYRGIVALHWWQWWTKRTLHLPVVSGDILVVFVAKYHCFVWFCMEILCLLAWFHRFAMVKNSFMDLESKGTSCSTAVIPFKLGNPFTPESDSSLDPSENYFKSSSCQSHFANLFVPDNESDNYSADLFAHH